MDVTELWRMKCEKCITKQSDMIIYTIGHSNHSIDTFIALLKRYNITAVADVRSVPYSRFNSQFNRENLIRFLENIMIAYVFLGAELGGRPNNSQCYKNGQADYVCMAKQINFKHGLNRIINGGKKYNIALMCSEKEPLDCHRSILICHALKTYGITIKHILSDGSFEYHVDTEKRLLKITESKDMEMAYIKRSKDIAYILKGVNYERCKG